MVFYFSEPDLRHAARPHGEAIINSFRELCDHNRDFLSALERTTKSLDANRTRFEVWAGALGAILGRPLASPIRQ